MSRRICNIAVIAITIVSTAVVIALGATSASASTAPECSGGAPRACIQVFGSGMNVSQVDGWIWNNTSSKLTDAHVELYTALISQGPLAGGGSGSVPLYGAGNGSGNCGSYNLAPGTNTPNCSGYNFSLYNFYYYEEHLAVSSAYLCAAAWQYANGAYYVKGWRCAYVWQ